MPSSLNIYTQISAFSEQTAKKYGMIFSRGPCDDGEVHGVDFLWTMTASQLPGFLLGTNDGKPGTDIFKRGDLKIYNACQSKARLEIHTQPFSNPAPQRFRLIFEGCRTFSGQNGWLLFEVHPHKGSNPKYKVYRFFVGKVLTYNEF